MSILQQAQDTIDHWKTPSIVDSVIKSAINAAAIEFWVNSEAHGFHGPNKHGHVATAAERIALIHSEASEALEELRQDPVNQEKLGAELADIVIRTLEMAVTLDIDIGEAIAKKHAINIDRPIRHGGKQL